MAEEYRGVADLFCDRAAAVLVEVGDYNSRTLGGEQERILFADAAGGAGDNHNFSLNTSHGRIFLW